MTKKFNSTTFVSYDGGVTERATYQRPDRYRMVESGRSYNCRIARGGGYSYAAASFGGDSLVIDMSRFNRILGIDTQRHLIEVEGGITLGELFSFSVRKGLLLPIQPGYPAITIGGCIAANVHGKNPYREGTFKRSVKEITLFHPRHGRLRVDYKTNRDVFDLTCGGYGLTGIILTVKLQLEPIPGSVASVERIRISNLKEGLKVIRSLSGCSAFAYTWHDATPSGNLFGRGFAYRGNIVPTPGQAATGRCYRVLTAANRGRLPFSLFGRLTTPLITNGYRLLEAMKPALVKLPIFDALFPFARRSEYFLLYGRRGLAEHQAVIPNCSINDYLKELQKRLLRVRAPAVMLSMKLFKGTQRFLNFEDNGVCVTIDLQRSVDGLRFLTFLDELTATAGGIPNIIKDSRLTAHVVNSCYREYEKFQLKLHEFDPDRVFQSELSRRLSL